MAGLAQTLDCVVASARGLEEVRKRDLRGGDIIVVTTRNSQYTIWVLDGPHYWVWGGWFDSQKMSPVKMAINGCTWGGSAIKQDIVAACGLRLEFGNRVLTTRIRSIRVIRAAAHFSLN
ncbi:MAG TPA: hypothetical protein VEJ39_04530 [Candidatus Acidoferrales bacterium]|nr:hypothetical protein [Candidatus Acidoferrales bacterium]